MTAVINTTDLTKFYGEHRGILDVNLEINEGEVFGLLGPNGAGKTTCIRVFLDFIRSTSGSATVLGMDSRTDSVQIRQRVGYLPGDFITYEKLTALELLEYFANLRGGNLVKARVLAERFNLDLTRKIGEFSRGNRQKVGLVQAFMSDPDLLILDEPTTGLIRYSSKNSMNWSSRSRKPESHFSFRLTCWQKWRLFAIGSASFEMVHL